MLRGAGVAETKPELFSAADVAIALSSLSALQSSALRCEDASIARLGSSTAAVTSQVAADVAAIISTTQVSASTFVADAHQRMRVTDKRLELLVEGLDAVQKTLSSFLQQLGADAYDSEGTGDALGRMLYDLDLYIPLSITLAIVESDDAVHRVNVSSRILPGIELASPCTSDSPAPLLTRGELNIVAVPVFGALCEPVSCVVPADVVCTFNPGCVGWAVTWTSIQACIASFGVVLTADCTDRATLCIHIWGSVALMPLKVP